MRITALCMCFVLPLTLVEGGPVVKRSLDLSSIKASAISYIKGIPSRWREFIPDDVYKKGVEKYNQIKESFKHHFEGDIAGIGINGQGNQAAVLAEAGSVDAAHIWPKGVVPYEIATSFAEHEVEVIKGALQDIMAKTCIKFVEHKTETDYISFVRRQMGCSSYVSRVGGQQLVDLQPGCIYEIGEVQHEVMHALGFYHEQSRTDRDEYVSIVWDNVKDEQRDQFKKYVSNTFGLKYDYDSIMHYGWNYFAIDANKPTILPKIKAGIGNRKVMSITDAERINMMYSCPQAGHHRVVNIPHAWEAKQEANPDWRPVVTPAPGSPSATKCFLSITTTPSSGIKGWLMNNLKTAAANKVCEYVNG